MNAPAVGPVAVDADAEIDLLIQSARASVARLTLDLRAVQYEIERVESGRSDADRQAARLLLVTSLAEMVDDHRRPRPAASDPSQGTVASPSIDTAEVPSPSPSPTPTPTLSSTPSPVPSPPLADANPGLAAARPTPMTDNGVSPYATLAEVIQSAVAAGLAQHDRGTAAPGSAPVAWWSRRGEPSRLVDIALPLIGLAAVALVILVWVD